MKLVNYTVKFLGGIIAIALVLLVILLWAGTFYEFFRSIPPLDDPLMMLVIFLFIIAILWTIGCVIIDRIKRKGKENSNR